MGQFWNWQVLGGFGNALLTAVLLEYCYNYDSMKGRIFSI